MRYCQTFTYPLWSVGQRSALVKTQRGRVAYNVGAFIFPLMLNSTAFKLPGAMGVGAAICVAGFLLTFVLPEPKQKSLETIEQEGEQMDERHEQKAGDAHTGETKPSYS